MMLCVIHEIEKRQLGYLCFQLMYIENNTPVIYHLMGHRNICKKMTFQRHSLEANELDV